MSEKESPRWWSDIQYYERENEQVLHTACPLAASAFIPSHHEEKKPAIHTYIVLPIDA